MINQYFNFWNEFKLFFSLTPQDLQVVDFYYVSCHVSHIVNIDRQTYEMELCAYWLNERQRELSKFAYTLHVALYVTLTLA